MSKFIMQRWEPEASNLGGKTKIIMAPSGKGDFVMNRIATTEIERLTKQNQELFNTLERATKTLGLVSGHLGNADDEASGMYAALSRFIAVEANDVLTKTKDES